MLALVIGVLLGSLLFSSFAVAQNDYEVRRCERIDPSDPCYRDLAVARNDAGICRLIESVATRNDCYSKIAKATSDKTLCLTIRKDRGTFEDKYECYEGFITGTEDRNFCLNDLKGDEKNMDGCLLKIALMEDDAALCDELSFEDAQMACIMGVAADLQDESLCHLIRSKIDFARCKSQEGTHCDAREKIDDALYECEKKILIGKRQATCRSKTGEKELNLDENEEQDLSFRGYDDPVSLKYKSASQATGVGILDVAVGGRTREMTLQPGMTGEHRFVNVYLIDIVERGTEEMPKEPRLSLCAYSDPSPPAASLPHREEQKPATEESRSEPVIDEEPEPEPVVDEAPDVGSQETALKATAQTRARPTFFQWFGGTLKGVGGFLKKILI